MRPSAYLPEPPQKNKQTSDLEEYTETLNRLVFSIGSGHAFNKHAEIIDDSIQKSKEIFNEKISETLDSPRTFFFNAGPKSYFYNNRLQFMVITDPGNKDQGTAFQPVPQYKINYPQAEFGFKSFEKKFLKAASELGVTAGGSASYSSTGSRTLDQTELEGAKWPVGGLRAMLKTRANQIVPTQYKPGYIPRRDHGNHDADHPAQSAGTPILGGDRVALMEPIRAATSFPLPASMSGQAFAGPNTRWPIEVSGTALSPPLSRSSSSASTGYRQRSLSRSDRTESLGSSSGSSSYPPTQTRLPPFQDQTPKRHEPQSPDPRAAFAGNLRVSGNKRNYGILNTADRYPEALPAPRDYQRSSQSNDQIIEPQRDTKRRAIAAPVESNMPQPVLPGRVGIAQPPASLQDTRWQLDYRDRDRSSGRRL